MRNRKVVLKIVLLILLLCPAGCGSSHETVSRNSGNPDVKPGNRYSSGRQTTILLDDNESGLDEVAAYIVQNAQELSFLNTSNMITVIAPNIPIGHEDYCSSANYGPCMVGEGDCDSDTECQTGLLCSPDVGARYGLPASYDVCESPIT